MLIPVPGHIELNIVRLLLKFLWTLVKKLGFRIDKAQLFVKNGIDQHCTHQILSCSLFLLSAELLWSYVHECQQKHIACKWRYLQPAIFVCLPHYFLIPLGISFIHRGHWKEWIVKDACCLYSVFAFIVLLNTQNIESYICEICVKEHICQIC